MEGQRTAEELAAEADGLLQADRSIEAFELYDKALSLKPDDASLLLRAGAALMQATQFREAYLYLQQAHSAYPENPEVLRLMGASALAGGQGTLALEAFVKMRELGGEVTADTLLDLAISCYYALRVPEALEYVDEALEMEPESDEAAEWKAKLDGYDSDHELMVDVARAHCREGRLGLGAEIFIKSFEFGDSFEARFFGGQAMLGIGRADNAEGLLMAALDMSPDHEETRQALAMAREILAGMDEDAELAGDAIADVAEEPGDETQEIADEVPEPIACPTCGRELKPDAIFCPACGRRVG